MSHLLTRVLADLVTEPVYQPTYLTESKFHGVWKPVERDLLKGYLIAVSRDGEVLAEAVGHVVEFCRVLGTDAGPVALSASEADLFGALGEPGRRALPMSRGYRMASGEVVVTEGPLRGREALIASVDRHKSTATLEVRVAGETVRARAGLALLSAGELSRAPAAMSREPDEGAVCPELPRHAVA